MASGCTSSSSPSLSNCANPTTDKCIKYTGIPIPSLGICTGDYLNELESIILQNIVAFASGVGIMISNIDYGTCNLFTQYITCCNASGDVPKSLQELMQVIFSTLCGLDTRLTTVEAFVTGLSTGPYTTTCLAGITGSSTFKQIVQAMLVKICNLDSRVTTLENEFTTLSSTLTTIIGNFLLSQINSCQGPTVLNKSGTGATASLQFAGAVPIGAVIAFDGDLSLFDSNGLGRTGTSACGWALCDGRGGRLNAQGVSIMGATVTGGTTNPAANGATYSHGTTGGVISVTLTGAQLPAMGVNINDPGHFHGFVGRQDSFRFSTTGGTFAIDAVDPTSTAGIPFFSGISGVIAPSTTGITASLAGGGQSHENRSPYIALEWIKRIS